MHDCGRGTVPGDAARSDWGREAPSAWRERGAATSDVLRAMQLNAHPSRVLAQGQISENTGEGLWMCARVVRYVCGPGIRIPVGYSRRISALPEGRLVRENGILRRRNGRRRCTVSSTRQGRGALTIEPALAQPRARTWQCSGGMPAQRAPLPLPHPVLVSATVSPRDRGSHAGGGHGVDMIPYCLELFRVLLSVFEIVYAILATFKDILM